jgi:hypothetical protein
MKNTCLILALLVSTIGFAQKESLLEVQFSSITRGESEYLTLTADSVKYFVQNRIKNSQLERSRLINSKEWKSLESIVKSIDLTKMRSIVSPSQKRQYDGARHSSIVVISNLGSYNHLFDDEEPHESLIDLMKCLQNIRKRTK